MADTHIPRISVVLPAYNVEAYVGETLASLFAQTESGFEVIAVDDGSTDSTVAILEGWRERFAERDLQLTIVRRSNGGAGAARNDALDRARGKLLCFVDADDLLAPEALALLADMLESDPSLDLVFPLCRHVDQFGRPTGAVSGNDARSRYSARDLVFQNPIHTGTGVMIVRERAEATGRFDTSLPGSIDIDYWIRVVGERDANIAPVPRLLVDYRARPGQITEDWRRMRRGWERVLASAEKIGLRFEGRQRDAALARSVLYWSAIAYKHDDAGAARSLMFEAWRLAPLFALTSRAAWLHTAACLVSLAPKPMHDKVRDTYRRLSSREA